jgi:hypothetical protein
VEAFTKVAPKRDDVQLAVFIARKPSRRKSRRHLEVLEEELERAGLADRVRILFGLPLVPAFRPNAIYVRTTRSEGDAVSVREACRARVPVVASDVVDRPRGVITFSMGSVTELSDRLQKILDESANEESSDTRGQVDESMDAFLEPLILLYRSELAAESAQA